MIAFVTFCPYVADLRHFVLFEWSSFERLLLVAVVVAVEVVLAVAVVPSKINQSCSSCLFALRLRFERSVNVTFCERHL